MVLYTMVFKLDIYGSQILSKYDGKFGKKKKKTTYENVKSGSTKIFC